MPQHHPVLVTHPGPGRDHRLEERSTTATAGTQPWAIKTQPTTLSPAPTDNPLSQAVVHLVGSRQTDLPERGPADLRGGGHRARDLSVGRVQARWQGAHDADGGAAPPDGFKTFDPDGG